MPPAPRDQPAADHGTRSSGARRCRWWARHGSDGEDAVAAAEGALEHRPLRRPGIAAPLLRKAQPKQRAGDGRNLRWASGDLEIHNVLADQSRDGGTSDVVGGSTRPDLVAQRRSACLARTEFAWPAIRTSTSPIPRTGRCDALPHAP